MYFPLTGASARSKMITLSVLSSCCSPALQNSLNLNEKQRRSLNVPAHQQKTCDKREANKVSGGAVNPSLLVG